MRPRKIHISMVVPVNIMGKIIAQPVPIAELKIVKLCDELKADTERVCPNCGATPKFSSGYECICGEKYGHFSKLKQLVKATKEEIIRKRLIGEDDIHARLWRMTAEGFSRYTDGTKDEYGVTVTDDLGALNLKKLLIASKLLNQVIIVTYDDTFEQRIALLTTTEAGTVILREIVPLNLADVRETLKVSFSGLTEQEISEAKSFVDTLPIATEETLKVNDYRTIGIEEKAVVSAKAQDLGAILQKVEAKS